MAKKNGRPLGALNWPLTEQLARFHAPLSYICRQLKTDEKRLCREVKNIYKETWGEFSKRLREEGTSFLVGKMWQKATQGNDKWMFHVLKFYCGHNDFELEMQVKEKYANKDSEHTGSTLDQLYETSKEFVKLTGEVAEPRPAKDDEKN